MRDAFIKTLYDLTAINKDICLLTGDLGFTVFEKFKSKLPDNFFNMGVAEGNMVGVATGLAMSGKIPFVYSIAPFLTLRALEQIRDDVCLHNANVKIVGVGGGLSYANAGSTHHATEDISVMRSLPNMAVLCPCDPNEVVGCVKAAVKHNGPVYLRIGKKGEPNINPRGTDISLQNATYLKKGTDLVLISCGPIMTTALEVSTRLNKQGVSTGLVSMHSVKPLDTSLLKKIIKDVKNICTIEEHSVIGGLGSAVSEFISESTSNARFKRIGIEDNFTYEVGDHDFIKNLNNLSSSKITKTILEWMQK